MLDRLPFKQIWAVDFEFIANPGERPIPVCLVAWELRSGQKLRLWADQLGPWPPFSIGPKSLFVAYYAAAELGCFRALNWPAPAHRNSTNLLSQKGTKPIESSLLGGIYAPVLLAIARIIQGLSLGGEYGTSATYLTEMADQRHRGFYQR